MLGELRRIREVLTEEPAPPPPPPKGFVEEFVQFLNKYGVIGLAIAFIMGGAVSKLVSALVSDIIMPVIGVFIRDGGWREAVLNLGPIPLAVGSFTGALLDFLIIAFVIFIMMRQLGKTGLK
ncbi:MAG: MscL family protein [Candidatus Bathyarchaeota archaeon]|nr:MAG: MscL family protein [Candidatus Bathyarchaeota archaeon]